MTQMTDRRDFLRTAARGVAAGLSIAGFGGVRAAFAQSAPAAVSAVPLTENLVQITGGGGNVVALAASEGLVLVDSGAAATAPALQAFIAERFGGAPVQALFNTHWHPENTGGNEIIGRGARIYAHENTRLWMSTEFYVPWQKRTYSPRFAEALPTDTFYSSDPQPITLSFGDRRVEYGHLREAHTDGDIYIFFPEENVIVAGGVVSAGTFPILDYTTGGWIGGMADATRKLIEMSDTETRIVPEIGPAQGRADLEAQHEMLVTVKGRVEDLMRRGRSAEEMIAEGVTQDFNDQWGNHPDLFVSNVYEGMWWGSRLSGSL